MQPFAPSAVSDLTTLVLTNALASQYEQFIDRNYRQEGSLYQLALARQDQKSADAALASSTQWTKRARMSEFASAVAPLAQALFALSQADAKSVKVLTCNDGNVFPKCSDIVNPKHMFVAFNQEVRKSNGLTLPGAYDWEPHGQLGLKAVTLQAGLDGDGEVVAQLSLVLPLRSADPELNKNGFAIVTIALTGHTYTYTFEPSFNKNGYLMYQLGMVGADRAIRCASGGGEPLDTAVGFPGATDYLANALPNLAKYLSAMAAALSEEASTAPSAKETA